MIQARQEYHRFCQNHIAGNAVARTHRLLGLWAFGRRRHSLHVAAGDTAHCGAAIVDLFVNVWPPGR